MFKIFVTALLLGLQPNVASATQWVGCSGGDFVLDLVVNTDATSISDFALFIKDVPQDSKRWVIKKKRIRLRERIVDFEAVSPDKKLRLSLQTLHKKGTLHVGRGTVQVSCNWTAWDT